METSVGAPKGAKNVSIAQHSYTTSGYLHKMLQINASQKPAHRCLLQHRSWELLWNQPSCPAADGWRKEMWFIDMEVCSALKTLNH